MEAHLNIGMNSNDAIGADGKEENVFGWHELDDKRRGNKTKHS